MALPESGLSENEWAEWKPTKLVCTDTPIPNKIFSCWERESWMGRNLGKYIRQPFSDQRWDGAESKLMTGIVPYATNPRFMAKKIPQSDLYGGGLPGKILIWRYGILLIKTGRLAPPPLSSIIKNFSREGRAVSPTPISHGWGNPKPKIGICQNRGKNLSFILPRHCAYLSFLL